MHSPRRLIATVATVATIVVVTACDGDGETAPTTTTIAVSDVTTTTVPRQTDGRLDIGLFLPRTGPGAQFGEPMIAAIQDTVAEINQAGGVLDRPIRLEVVDEAGDAGVTALRELEVDAVIGPASSNVALTQLGTLVGADNGIVTCSPMATGLVLDDFPDNGYFFRTAPSDSLQMAAIARRAVDTGVTSAAVGYLDDPYGRGLRDALATELDERGIEVVDDVGFGVDQEDLTSVTTDLLANRPGVVIVLGDADDGSRLLSALDGREGIDGVRRIIVNDAIRSARTTLQSLTPEFRERLLGVAPSGTAPRDDAPQGFFTAHAVDCVTLIALAATSAGTDDPAVIQTQIVPMAREGRVCSDFETCAGFLAEGLSIDFNGMSGELELANSSGDLQRANFESFTFDENGAEQETQIFVVF